MEELLVLLEPLMEHLSPMLAWAIGITIAFMEGIKKWDENKNFKKWYWAFGAGISAVFALFITFTMGSFSFGLFLIHFLAIAIVEAGIDIMAIKPIVKQFLPFVKKFVLKK